ncbi:MAG: aminomethyl transferase family protein [Candidatus Cloacimonadaceae bacterium]|nr:aminomethyl transferase family protein [Candidatus Cloacimonadaceae bacterium]MDP3113454.1 aminomethyl transferase family protein [Candidatus Cloacimonadaceae bacterium]
MTKLGFDFPAIPRKTFLYDLEEKWYNPMIAKHLGKELQAIKRSNFGEYNMAVNYTTSVLEEAAAIEKVAVYNIDHMAQIHFSGKDCPALLDRVLGGSMSEMKIGSCKYTLLLNETGGVQDDMILMRLTDTEYIMVINAGHDITDTIEHDSTSIDLIADLDRIMMLKLPQEEVYARDISDTLVKVDIQGPLSFKLIKQIFGADVLKNRNQPDKNMNFFSFNEFAREGHKYYISRTGYTNRWGWELYIPNAFAEEDFKAIVSAAVELGGLLVGLGGRDENRISAGTYGLPLMGSEYDPIHSPVNAPLFDAAIDMNKDFFVGKAALEKELTQNPTKHIMIFIAEGIASNRGIYLNDQRIGTVTSSINSPNLSHEKRLAIGSSRKNVNDENGTAAIGIGWLYNSPFEKDAEGNDITEFGGLPTRIPAMFFREDAERKPKGSPLLGYLTAEGISPATAPKPLKNIENL